MPEDNNAENIAINKLDDSQVDEIFENAVDVVMNGNLSDGINVEVNGDIDEKSNLENDINHYIETANAKVLLNTLAPQVSKNEEKKREHKDKLIRYISLFLGAQFLIIFILVMIVIISIIVFHALKNDFSSGTINMLFAFFGTYITSVIVELICILKFIVVNVFDTSISALMKVFTKTNTEQENN